MLRLTIVFISVLSFLWNVSTCEEPNYCGCDRKCTSKEDAKIACLEEKIAALEVALAGATANSRCQFVAFRVRLTRDLGGVKLGETIIFDEVDFNRGKAYHRFHGVFTAPCNGTYLFSLKVGNINRFGVLHLKKNNLTVEYVWAGFNANWDMGGASTVVELAVGDEVWVAGRGTVSGDNSDDGVGNRIHVSFSGTLIHAF